MGQAGATPIRSRGTGGYSIGKQPELMTLLLNSASSSALLFHQIQETRCADLLFNKSAAKGCKRCSGNPVKDLVQSLTLLRWNSAEPEAGYGSQGYGDGTVWDWKGISWPWHSSAFGKMTSKSRGEERKESSASSPCLVCSEVLGSHW